MAHNLLLLHHRYTPDDQAIWKQAIRRGWKTERVGHTRVELELKLTPRPDMLRYYGNMMHIAECGDNLPIKFHPLDIRNLTQLQTWTKRKIELFTCKDVQMPIPERAFYKATGIKWLESRIYNAGDRFDCKPDDTIYKQEPIEIVDEIRTFVIDGEIKTASWYRINKEFIPSELEDFAVWEKLQSITNELWKAAKWPKGIVFDFGRLRDGSWCFIEANESYASGLYDCNPEKCFDTIIASQE